MTASDSTEPRKKKFDRAAYQKAWRESNKDRVNAQRRDYHKAYREANRERIKAAREANKEKLNAYGRTYYVANKGRMNAEAAANYRANGEAYKERARRWERENVERKRELRRAQYRKDIEKSRQTSRLDWQKHNAKRRAAKAEYRRQRPDLSAHHVRLRQTRKQKATPAWADLTAIKAKYAEAARLRRETGLEWHVDHEIPLRHPLVCGLHVHANLQVIPATVNQSKGNRLIAGAA